MQSIGKTMVRAALAAVVAGFAGSTAAACDKDAAKANPTTAPPSTATSASAVPPDAPGASPSVQYGRPKTPIEGIRADTLVSDWSRQWHIKIKPAQTPLVTAWQAKVDYPAGHGRLEFGVQLEGKGANPAPSYAYCVLRDKSLGTKFVNLTRTLLDRMLDDCWGAVLVDGEGKQIGDWAVTNTKKNAAGQIHGEHAFARFTVEFGRGPGLVSLAMKAQ